MSDNHVDRIAPKDRYSRTGSNLGAVGRQTVFETRKAFLAHHHLPLQKLLTYAFGPAMTLISIITMFTKPCWQSWFIAACMLATWASWWPALTLSKQQKPGKSTLIVLTSSLLYLTISMSLIGGLEAGGTLAALVLTIHASLYSRRYLYYGAAGSIVSFAISNVFQFYRPEYVQSVDKVQHLVTAIIIVTILVVVAALYLRRIYTLNETLFDSMAETNRTQNNVIETVNKIHPIITNTLKQIEEVSLNFANKASEQAETAAEVNITTNEVYHIAVEMVDASNETQSISVSTRKELIANSDRLQKVEQGFEKVVRTIDESRTDVIDLANQVERIEEILDANREIGQQIKILAINAAIEAAKAKEFGHGFRVVASKLRELIHITEENLESSHALLEEIRDKSKESSDTIKLGAEQMTHYFEDLHATGKTIENSAENFALASKQVEQIGYAAQEQQVGMKVVTATMGELDSTASELSDSANYLLEAVKRITKTQEELRVALSAR